MTRGALGFAGTVLALGLTVVTIPEAAGAKKNKTAEAQASALHKAMSEMGSRMKASCSWSGAPNKVNIRGWAAKDGRVTSITFITASTYFIKGVVASGFAACLRTQALKSKLIPADTEYQFELPLVFGGEARKQLTGKQGDLCKNDDDCIVGMSCIRGTCEIPCGRRRRCPENQLCDAQMGLCRRLGEGDLGL